jgi:hypothetical protein
MTIRQEQQAMARSYAGKAPHPSRLTHCARWAAVFLLWVLFAQAMGAAARTSLTIDEGLHITSGYSIWRTGDYRLVEEHPPLVKLIAAWPLLLVPDLPSPTTLDGWYSSASVLDSMRLVHATQDLIYAYQPIDRLVVAARIPIALLVILLGTVVFRWAHDMAGIWAGVLSLFWLAFDPNILAHAAVAGTDLGATCFIFLAMYTFWRYIRQPTKKHMLLAGVTLGLAQGAKLTGLLLFPLQILLVIAVIIQVRLTGTHKTSTMLSDISTSSLASVFTLQTGLFLIAGLTLWALYGFEIGTVPGVPFPVPAASHAIPWLRLNQHLADGHMAFLLGQISQRGWWYYFPVAFALKTPLPTLILLGMGLLLTSLRFTPHSEHSRVLCASDDLLTVSIFPLVYLATSMTNSLNIGYRHLLPVLPFIYVWMGGQVSGFRSQVSRFTFRVPLRCASGIGILRFTFYVLLLWYVIGTVRLFPHYLAYFNELAGGPDGGWRYLADSNTDWGQALKDLAAYQRAENIEQVRLSMFTFMDPAIYGVHYEPLTPMLGNTPAVFPSRFNPPPGDYVISATTLQGIPLADPEMFDWFRKREPDAKIGHVMFVYRLPARQPHTWVAQCITPVAPLGVEQITEGFGQSDLRPAYFDCAQSWLYPTGGQSAGWVVLAQDAPVGNPSWLESAYLSYEQKRPGFTPPFRIYEEKLQIANIKYQSEGRHAYVAPSGMGLAQALVMEPVDLPLSFEEGLTLLAYTLNRSTLKPGETTHLETTWRVERVPSRLLSLMAHVLGPDGQTMAVGDGLGVPIESWQAGDVFIQRHTLALPKDTPPGMYRVQTGVYWLEDGKRWTVRDNSAAGNRVLLEALEIR